MNEIFDFEQNASCIFTDEGITCRSISIHKFFPYGSFSSIKVNLFGTLILKYSGQELLFIPKASDKQRLKQVISYADEANRKAGKTIPVDIIEEEKEIKKDVSSLLSLFRIHPDAISAYGAAIKEMVDSMSEDETILHTFNFNYIYINGGKQSLIGGLGLITDKKFYFSGKEGNTVLLCLKTMAVELKDAHAVSSGSGNLANLPHVQFETKNEDYKISTVDNIVVFKSRLEKAIEKAKEKATAPSSATVIQNTLSPAEELKKFKELLDMGVITQEEFDAKKKQLLGL